MLEAEAALHAASHVAFSAQGVIDLAGCDDVEEAAMCADTILPGKIIATDGENGVVVINDGAPTWYPAFDITPVDTLGAGDVWHGAFALALGEGRAEADAVQFASAAAAIKCGRTGGRDGAPNRVEVAQFLREKS